MFNHGGLQVKWIEYTHPGWYIFYINHHIKYCKWKETVLFVACYKTKNQIEVSVNLDWSTLQLIATSEHILEVKQGWQNSDDKGKR